MLDENTRTAIALKRFSLIGPVLNGQVTNNKAYYSTVTEKIIDMPYYGARKYSPKTLESWYCDYMRGGIDALKPRPRGDKGGSRRIDERLGEKIIAKKKLYPKAPKTILYELLIKDGIIDPDKISLSTLYRYLKSEKFKNPLIPDEEEKEMKRFSHEYINQLWQTDVMYGPFVKDGKKRRQTYLFLYLDDASRLITHAQFYFSQNYESLRDSFKQALLKRGFPTLVYTDNGKIYRSQQFELLCANLGCNLIHSRPYEPNGRGKVERVFLTIRKRFLSTLDIDNLKDINDLNRQLFKWLDEDYLKKPHSALNGLNPLDFFMSQIDRAKLCHDPKVLDEKFLLKKRRKVQHDGTFSIDNILYETKSKFAGMNVEVRYEPTWLETSFKPVLIFLEDKKVGEARQVNFHDNAHMKRKGRPPSNSTSEPINIDRISLNDIPVEQTISFTKLMGEGN